MKTIDIIGGGIGGLCAAIALRRQQFEVRVFEAAPAVRPVGAGLVLAANAMKALTSLGVADEVQRRGRALRQFRILADTGAAISVMDSQAVGRQFGAVDNFSIHRAALHEALLQFLPAGTVQPGKRLTSFAQDDQGVTATFADGSQSRADLLIAADGVHSPVRRQLLPGSAPRYAGYTCWRGLTSTLSPGLDANTATETWGRKGRVGMVPLADGRVYWFACLNAPEQDPNLAAMTPNDLAHIFRDYHAPLPQVLAATPADHILHHDIIDLAPIRQFAFGRVALLGDAAHATTPNLGQGACQAIEDAVVLARCLADAPDAPAGLRAYEQRRIGRTTAIVNRSWQLGRAAQLENPWLIRLRNAVLRRVPASLNRKQLEFIYNVDLS